MSEPERMVAFLFTDVKGSVPLWQRQPHLMGRLLKRHNEIIEIAALRSGGHQFKTAGDSCLTAFGTAGRALEAAISAQEALLAEDWEVDGETAEPLLVRMAVHCGAAIVQGNDYLGPEVNRTSRLLAKAQPGKILVSKSVQQLTREDLPVATELVALGKIEVRDFGEEEVYELVATAERASWIQREHDRLGSFKDRGSEPTKPSRPPDRPGIREFLSQRIAIWTDAAHDLDRRFTPITIRLAEWSCGEAGWSGDAPKFDDLWTALSALPHRSVVLLGEPGSGKSTLLRHLDLVLARRRIAEETGPIPFYVELNRFQPQLIDGDGSALAWLESQWSSQGLEQAPLSAVMRDPGLVFLLDGLDELPRETEKFDRSSFMRWKRFVQDAIPEHSPCRAILTCRVNDYGLPLSTPSRAVPILYTQALDDEQIRKFIDSHSSRSNEIRAILESWDVNGLLRNPFTLRLALDHVGQHGRLPTGRAELFATLVRQVTLREIERDHPLFRAGGVLSDRDLKRNLLSPSWKSSHALPDDSGLFTALGELAHELAAQMGMVSRGYSHVGMNREAAVEVLGPSGVAFLAAGTALGLLEENTEHDTLRFSHLLVQSFLAARLWLAEPRIDLIDRPLLKSEVNPPLESVLQHLTPSDVLPPIPPSVWEDVARLAAEMTTDQTTFVSRLADRDLALAGRAASDPGVEISTGVRRDVGERLALKSEDPAVDLRARIEAAGALELLGDPRFVLQAGEYGEYRLPPIIEVPAGSYSIGSDERESLFEGPCRSIELSAFGIGRYPVTVAEYERFIVAGGYDEERWWKGDGAPAWRRGVDTGKHRRTYDRTLYDRFCADPGELNRLFQSGSMPRRAFEKWSKLVQMTVEAFDSQSLADHPDVRYDKPAYLSDPLFTSPSRPVVGVSWYEARAYCAWLAAQTGRPFRLPTELEYEAASRGLENRAYPWGDTLASAGCSNVAGTHIQGTTPVGVFPEGNTPDGIADLFGNVMQWTVSAWGMTWERCEFPYPTAETAHTENDSLHIDVLRVLKGKAWDSDLKRAHISSRGRDHPEVRGNNGGFRVAVDL